MSILSTTLLLATGFNMTFPDSSVWVSFDDAGVAPYTLENPLTFADGTPVLTEEDWQVRRREILTLFEREMYGRRPPLPEALVTDLVDEKITYDGKIIQRQYEMHFKANRSGPTIRWIVFLPKNSTGKAPVILLLNYHGNQSLVNDPEIPMMTSWHRNGKWGHDHRAIPETRGLLQRPAVSAATFPLEEFARRGYAVMSACYCEVSPDPDWTEENPLYHQNPFAYTGVFDLWGKRDPARDDNTTALGAWAWALSRGLDLAGRIPHRHEVTDEPGHRAAAVLARAVDLESVEPHGRPVADTAVPALIVPARVGRENGNRRFCIKWAHYALLAVVFSFWLAMLFDR